MFANEREGASYADSMSLDDDDARTPAAAPTELTQRTSRVPDEKRCGACGRKVPLWAQAWKCRCEQVFCDQHRAPEQHACTFDYQAAQKAKLRKENQPVRKDAARIDEFDTWQAEYLEDHAPRDPYALGHAVGCVLLLLCCARGLLLLLLGSLLAVPQHALLGASLGYAAAHAAPTLYLRRRKRAGGRPVCGGGCRFCVFSWDVLTNASFACRADAENVKDQLLYHVITRRCTNCLSHLYTGSNRSAAHVAQTLKARVLR
jgi:hypothetical protein